MKMPSLRWRAWEQSTRSEISSISLRATLALGHDDEARLAVAGVTVFDQKATLRSLAPGFLDIYKEADDREHLRANLLKAGLQE